MKDKSKELSFIADYNGLTGDSRLDKRAQSLFQHLSNNPCSNISAISENRAEQVGYYRLLENERLSEQNLIEELTSRVSGLVDGRDILCIEDTCEINVSRNKGRLKPFSGLGRSDNNENATCFKIHPGLVLDANNYNPLGFSAIKIFHRPENGADRFERKYKSQPIEDKESFKWIEIAEKSKEILKTAKSVTFIQDREGDIYEQFARIPTLNTHLLIRSRTTRNLTSGLDLYTEVDSSPVVGQYTIEVPTDNRKNQNKRTALIVLRYKSCQIKRPANLRKKQYPDYLTVNCVSIKEITEGVNRPISWKLLTTHTINSYEDALKIVEWYKSRWYVEQVFRLLKQKGFGIENTQLESGWAIRKLVLMQLSSLLKILQMNIAYNQPEGGQPIDEVFTTQEIEVLHQMNKKLQGKTLKTQNKNSLDTTKWAAWVIGRLGGWKGYNSQGPPGVVTMKKGLDRLAHIIEGIRLARDMCTE